jgi:hypothetical protein
MDVNPVGVGGTEIAARSPPIPSNGGFAKAECARCTDLCMFEHIAAAMTFGSCRQMRAEMVAAEAGDSYDRVRASIDEQLDRGTTPDQVAVAMGLTADEFYAIYSHVL